MGGADAAGDRGALAGLRAGPGWRARAADGAAARGQESSGAESVMWSKPRSRGVSSCAAPHSVHSRVPGCSAASRARSTSSSGAPCGVPHSSQSGA